VLFQVILVREELVKRGFEVWMDIMGGMDTDLYESMAGLDEGLPALSRSNLLYMENPYSYKKFQRRMTARPRISAQAFGVSNACAMVVFMSQAAFDEGLLPVFLPHSRLYEDSL